MTQLYLKALHIIFIVTWFSGMFYIVRLFIYNAEAQAKTEPEKTILTRQFQLMIRRLWYGITWPSAMLTLIFGPLVWKYTYTFSYFENWLMVKLIFVVFLYVYHFSIQAIVNQQLKGIFKYTSQQLRIWNEVATIFLIPIVMLATVKDGMSWVWGFVGLIVFIIVIMGAIKIYKMMRKD
jgi:putative membrane protein